MDQAQDVGTALGTRGAVAHGTDPPSQQSLVNSVVEETSIEHSPAPFLPPATEIWDNSTGQAQMSPAQWHLCHPHLQMSNALPLLIPPP